MAQHTRPSDDPFGETLATTGLFLTMTAVIALAVSLASWGTGATLIGVLCAAVALISFATSISCFRAQAGADPAAEGAA